MRYWALFFFACFFSQPGWSQPDLGAALENTLSGNKPSLLLRLDSRNSFMLNAGVKITGIKLGLAFGEGFKTGVGYNFLSGKSARKIAAEIAPGPLDVRLNFFSLFAEYRFYRRHPFYASIPVQLGVGSFRVADPLTGHLSSSPVVLYEAMLSGELRFLRYFGAGLGAGYRLGVVNSNKYGVGLTSPIYNVKFNLYFRDLYQDLFK